MKNGSYNHVHINLWYVSFRTQLISAGLRFGLETEEVKDLINQLFLDLLEKNVDTSAIENPQAYIGKCFKRRLIDHTRVCKRISVTNDSIHENGFEPSIADTIDIIQCNIELKNKIKKAYDKLPERCKKVIYLKYYEGKTTEQIAEETNLAKRTVYNNLFEGLKLLRSEFVSKSNLSIVQILAALSICFADRLV